jgi:hypothetical protein
VLGDATVIGGAAVRTELGAIPLPSLEVNGSSSSLTRRCREPAGTTAPSQRRPWTAYTPSFGQSRDASVMPVPTNSTMAKSEFCRDRGKVGAEATDVVAVLQGSHAHSPAVTQSSICRSHAVRDSDRGKVGDELCWRRGRRPFDTRSLALQAPNKSEAQLDEKRWAPGQQPPDRDVRD